MDVPGLEPDDQDWVKAEKVKGFQGPRKGRLLGSGLDVRLSLHEVSTVVFRSDVLSVILRDGLVPGFGADAVGRVKELRATLSFFSDQKNERPRLLYHSYRACGVGRQVWTIRSTQRDWIAPGVRHRAGARSGRRRRGRLRL